MKNRLKSLLLPFGIIVTLVAGYAVTTLAQEKKKINRADELPRRNIELTGQVRQIFEDDALLKKIADQVYANGTADLDAFDIRDKATLTGYHSTLMLIDYQRKDWESVLRRSEIMKSLDDKEEERASAGLITTAYVRAARIAGDDTSALFTQTFKKEFSANLRNADAKLIHKWAEQTRLSTSLLNRERMIESLHTQLQPFIDNGKGTVPENVAATIAISRYSIDMRLRLKDITLAVLDEWLSGNKTTITTTESTFWKDRDRSLSAKEAKNNVVLAVWDTGVDPVPFASQMWVNKREIAGNGKDDDKNGFIDDVHGIPFDMNNAPTTGPLLEKRKLTYELSSLQRWMKGAMDLQSGIESAEGKEFQQRAISLKPEEGIPFQEDLAWYGTYAHGTHVAGISIAGNPAARILFARLTYDTRVKPRLYTNETQANMASMFTKTVDYFRKNNVRVVNMSWRYNAQAYEAVLALYGVGKDENERKEIAKGWFEAEKASLRLAFESAPEILFICGSGNENNDANFADYIPAGIDLPNVVTVGAVDNNGKRTSFTTEGKSVDFYANGYEVESFVPGGGRMKFSGTSMASPQVANLAAKMLSLNPSLSPIDIIKIIKSTATPDPEGKGLLLIHPANAIEKLKAGN